MSSGNYYAGLGCRRGCTAAELQELLMQTLRTYDVRARQLVALASIDAKRGEDGLHELAEQMQLPLVFFSAQQLILFEPRLLTPSDVARRETGVAGIAEACALAALETSGVTGTLLGPRCKSAMATCALARAAVVAEENFAGAQQ